MCELLGMSANVPTDICFSFAGLMKRGGQTGPHRDGWGIAFYEGKAFREFKDPEPSCNSVIAGLVRDYPIKSHVVISHIRQANSGDVNLENTHPFSRELWGQAWVYAHNGQLDKSQLETNCLLNNAFYQPIGTTDSEWAFCWMMSKIRQTFPIPPDDPNKLHALIHKLCRQLSTYGVFNLLLSNSQYLFAYCTTKLVWITRKAPFGEAKLKDEDLSVNFKEETRPDDIVTVIATEALTHNESWNKLNERELAVFV